MIPQFSVATDAADGDAASMEEDGGRPPSGGLSVPAPGGLFPLANSQQIAGGSATGNPRNKVALQPGFSLMDWIRLTKSGKDLTGTGGKLLRVTKKELAKHKKRKDAWMAINGKVYNVTSYMDYHPGGWDELMRGVGKDATDLFNEVHRWVNYESMLAACLVGKLVDEPPLPTSAGGGIKMPPPMQVIPPIKPRPQTPTFDFHQTDTSVVISVYTRRKHLTHHNVIVSVEQSNRFNCLVLLPNGVSYSVDYTLFGKVLDECSVNVGATSGKVEVHLKKAVPNERWANLGIAGEENNLFGRTDERKQVFREWTIAERKMVTHDVQHIVLTPPSGLLHFQVPLGHHIRLSMPIEGMDIVRSYTPVPSGLFATDEPSRSLHFLVKIYKNGAFTSRLKEMKEGSRLSVSNHEGSFTKTHLDDIDHLILIAAGTGFTPMAKLIQQYSKHKQTKLFFFNKTERDIMWKDQLANLKNCDVHHVLSQEESQEWQGERGRVSADLLQKYLHTIDGKKLACVCGPTLFTSETDRLLREIGFKSEEIHLFQG